MAAMQDRIARIENQKDLSDFIEYLAESYSKKSGSWSNRDLESYLRAMSAWVREMDGYYRNTGQDYNENKISWKNVADMLMAATMYE